MKYIDEKRMRFGYIGIFAVAVALIGGALWDANYNDQALLNWFISGLGGLLLIAIFFFVATELILKDALDLRPRPVAAGALDQHYGVLPSNNQVPTKVAYDVPALPTAQAVPATSVLERPAASERSLSRRVAEEREPWTPDEQTVVKVPRAPVKIEMPEPVIVNAKPRESTLKEALPESPSALPKPKKVEAAPHGIHLQTLAYEVGNSQFRVPRGSKGHRGSHAVLESTRVLCGDCGLYFRVDLDRARPMSVNCPQCTKDLGLSGATTSAEHIRMRCRFCGDFLQMPRVSEHHSTQCATCGQING